VTVSWKKTRDGPWATFGPINEVSVGTVTVAKKSGDTVTARVAKVSKPFQSATSMTPSAGTTATGPAVAAAAATDATTSASAGTGGARTRADTTRGAPVPTAPATCASTTDDRTHNHNHRRTA